METDNSLKPKDILDLVHKEIHYEHSLISNRMSWYVTSQSFLMATVTFAASHTDLLWLTNFIPILGSFISLVTWISLQAAIESMDKLKETENKILELEGMNEIPFATIRGDISNPQSIHFRGMLPPLLFPFMFLSTWIILFFGI